MTAINPYQVAITDGIYYVVISNTKTGTKLKNDVRVRTKSTSVSKRESTTPETQTKITNKVKIEKSYAISGHIAEGKFEYVGSTTETYTHAVDKYDKLIAMVESGKTLSIIYRGVIKTGAIRALDIDEIGTQLNNPPPDGTIVYDVSIDFVVGVDRLVKT